jgi:RNA polymerase sigma factor (TIGR02999 family)
MRKSGRQIARLLEAWSEGDRTALDRLMPIVYQDLDRLANRYVVQERPGHALQALDLVHETYLRLLQTARPRWQGRAHFFALCARIMRRILVDSARSRGRQKRGANAAFLCLHKAVAMAEDPAADLVDEALTALAAAEPRKRQVVELKVFSGFSAKETAAALCVSQETAKRDWRLAKIWLRREIGFRPY